MKFTEINYQGTLRGTDYFWGVHVEGCADIKRDIIRQFGPGAYRDGSTYYIVTEHEATSMRELLDKIVDGETRELGYHDDNVKVHNCVVQAFRPLTPIERKRKVEATKAAIRDAAAKALDNIAKPETVKAIEETLNAMMPKADATGRRHGAGGRFVKK